MKIFSASCHLCLHLLFDLALSCLGELDTYVKCQHLLPLTIDYRWDNRCFWLSAHNCQVPTPYSQNLATRIANLDLSSRLTHQLLWRLKSTIPNLQIYLPKMANSEKLGLGLDNPCRAVFCVCGWTNAWRGLMTGIFGILESSATQWYQDVASTRHFFFSSSYL
jgi:hypothetical protein